jgi:hypothetical protein
MSTKTAITGLLFYQVLLFSTNQSVNAGLGYSILARYINNSRSIAESLW